MEQGREVYVESDLVDARKDTVAINGIDDLEVARNKTVNRVEREPAHADVKPALPKLRSDKVPPLMREAPVCEVPPNPNDEQRDARNGDSKTPEEKAPH